MPSYVSAYMGTVFAAIGGSFGAAIISAFMGADLAAVVSSINNAIFDSIMCTILIPNDATHFDSK